MIVVSTSICQKAFELLVKGFNGEKLFLHHAIELRLGAKESILA
jgi:hypothetical protein